MLEAYPHGLTGGMGEWVMIAMMLIPDPDLLIGDEPTSALDVTVQAEVLKILDQLVRDRGLGLIFISHNLPLVSRFCGRVIVMYKGRLMEELAAEDLHAAPHPYTRGLLNGLPKIGDDQARCRSSTARLPGRGRAMSRIEIDNLMKALADAGSTRLGGPHMTMSGEMLL